jgi:hypothetical protein
MAILLFLVGLVGMGGTLIFGVMLGFEALSAAKFRADGRESWQLMKGEAKRSTKGTLKLFLISLALMAAGLLIGAAVSH